MNQYWKNQVWEHSKSRSIDRLVLLMLAMKASHDGYCCIDMGTIVDYSGASLRRCEQALKNIVASGEIMILRRDRDGLVITFAGGMLDNRG